jgi:RNAse (barnase) inhibitor barstar
MKHIVQFSGGVGSAMAAYLVTQQYPKEDIILLYHDVPDGQDDDTYRFNEDISKFLGIPITEVSDGRSLWDVIRDNKSLPSLFIPFCTRVLKLEQGEKFYKTLNEPFIIYTGYCFEEKKRVEKAKEKMTRPTEFPVYEARLTSKQCKQIIANEWGIKLPRAYKYFEHNNCIPCFKSTSYEYWRKVYEYFPERYQLAVKAEQLIGHTHFKQLSLFELAQLFEKNKTYNSKITISQYLKIKHNNEIYSDLFEEGI